MNSEERRFKMTWAEMHASIDEAVALLRELEWTHGVDGEKVCVCCHDFVHGHGCKLAAFLGRYT